MRTRYLRNRLRLAPLRLLWCTTAILLVMQQAAATTGLTATDAAMGKSGPPGLHSGAAAEPEDAEKVTAQPPPD